MKRSQPYFDEGEATFYKTDRFTLETSKEVSLADVAMKVGFVLSFLIFPFSFSSLSVVS